MAYGKLTSAAAAALIVAALGGCETMNALLDDKPAGQTESDGAQSAAAMPPQQQDVTFVQTAAAASSKEVALGELAVERSTNPAIDSFAQEMVTDHGAANTELMGLAEARSIDVPAAPSEAEAATEAGLGSLEGKAFDAAYAEQMVKDHEAAVALFEAQAAQGADPALAAFAEEKLPTLREHLEHARTLQSSL
jgi:putative membrane protein